MVLLAILEYAILAATFTIAKIAVGYADPLFLISVRMVLSSPAMFLIHYWQGQGSFTINRKDMMLFFLVSIFHIFIPFVGEFWALQFVSSARTAITYSLTPFVAAVLSFFLLKKKLSIKQIFGLCLGLLGILPIFLNKDDITHVAGELFYVSLPELVLLFSVISASYAWFIVADLMGRGYGISLINGVAMFFGGVFSFILWFLTSSDQFPIKGDFKSFVLWTALLIIVANLISYNLYGWLLRNLSINFMSAMGFLCPIFASAYGVFLLGEKLGMSHLIALIMVSLGLMLFYQEEYKNAIASDQS